MTPDEFRTWRIGAGMTQKEAADYLELLSTQAVRNYEAG
jgi:hypothetical protein